MAGNVNDILIKIVGDMAGLDATTKAAIISVLQVQQTVETANKAMATSQEAAAKAAGKTAKLTADAQVSQKDYAGALQTLQTQLKRTAVDSDEFLVIQKKIAQVTAKIESNAIKSASSYAQSRVAASDYAGAIKSLTEAQSQLVVGSEGYHKLGIQIAQVTAKANSALIDNAKAMSDAAVKAGNYVQAGLALKEVQRGFAEGTAEHTRLEALHANVLAKSDAALLSQTKTMARSQVLAGQSGKAIETLTNTQQQFNDKTETSLKLGIEIAQVTAKSNAALITSVKATSDASVAAGNYVQASLAIRDTQKQFAEGTAEHTKLEALHTAVMEKSNAALIRQMNVTAHAQVTTGQYGSAISTLTKLQSQFDSKSEESIKIGDQIAAIRIKQQKSIGAMATSFAAFKTTAGSFDEAIGKLQHRLGGLTEGTTEFNKVSKQLVETYKAQTSAIINTAKTQRQIGDVAGAVQTLKTAMAEAGEGSARFNKLNGVMQEMLDGVVNRTRQLSAHLTRLGAQWAATLTLPLQQFAKAAVESFTQIDVFRRSLTAMSGSAEKTNEQLERLRVLASSPGLTFQTAIQGVVRLEAVGVEAAKAEKIVRSFGNALALTGGTADELANVNIQLSQMLGKGKVLAQDLRPIISAAPAIAKSLQEAFGSVDAQVISDQLEAAGKSTKDFVDILVRQMDRLPRVLPGIREAFLQFSTTLQVSLSKFGESIANLLIPVLNTLGPMIEQLAKDFAALPPSIQGVVVILGTLIALAPVAAFLIGQLADSIASLIQIMATLRTVKALDSVLASVNTAGVASLGVLKALGNIFAHEAGFVAGVKAVGTAFSGLGTSLAAALGPGGIVIATFAGLAALTYGLHQLEVAISKDVVPATNEQILAQVDLIKTTNAAVEAQKKLTKEVTEQAKSTGDAAQITRTLVEARDQLTKKLESATEVEKASLQQLVSSVTVNVGNAIRQVNSLAIEIERLRVAAPQLEAVKDFGFLQAKVGALPASLEDLGAAFNKTEADMKAANKVAAIYGEQMLNLQKSLGLTTIQFEDWLRVNKTNEIRIKAVSQAMEIYLNQLHTATTATEELSRASRIQNDALRTMEEALKALDFGKMKKGIEEQLLAIATLQSGPKQSTAEARKQLADKTSTLSRTLAETLRIQGNLKELDKLDLLQKDKSSKSATASVKKGVQLRLDALKEELRAVEITNEAKARAEEDLVKDKTQTEQGAATALIALEKDTFKKRQEVFDAERAVLAQSELPTEEKRNAIKKLNNDELAAENAHIQKLEDIRRKANDAEKEDFKDANEIITTLAKQREQSLLEIAEITARRRTAVAKREADLGDITFEEAARISVREQQKVLNQRKKLVEEELNNKALSITEQERLNQELRRLQAEQAEFEAGINSQIQEGQQEDIERRRKYNEERLKLAEELTSATVAANAAQIRATLSLPGATDKQRKGAVLDQLKNESNAIEAEYADRKRRILAQVNEAAAAAKAAHQDEILARIDAEQKATEILLQARKEADAKQIINQQKQSVAQMGAITGGISDAVDVLAAGVGSARDVVKESYLVAVNAATQATQEMLDTWIETGKVGPGAMKKLVHGMLKELSHLWLAKGIAELAEGIAALVGIGTQGKAAGHFASAAKFFAAAAVAGIGARATASTQGAGGGSASGAIANTGGLNAAKSEATQTNFSRGVAAGLIGGFQEVINPFLQQQQEAELRFKGMVQVHADKMDQQLDAQIHYTEVLLGVTTPLTTLAGTVEGMSPGDVVGRGAQQNPVAVARGTARGIATDAWERQRLVDNLGV